MAAECDVNGDGECYWHPKLVKEMQLCGRYQREVYKLRKRVAELERLIHGDAGSLERETLQAHAEFANLLTDRPTRFARSRRDP